MVRLGWNYPNNRLHPSQEEGLFFAKPREVPCFSPQRPQNLRVNPSSIGRHRTHAPPHPPPAVPALRLHHRSPSAQQAPLVVQTRLFRSQPGLPLLRLRNEIHPAWLEPPGGGSIASVSIQHPDSLRVPPALEGRVEPHAHEFERQFFRHHPLPDGDYVGVVVLPP